MDLDIFVSKKGTKVVLASALHQALQLSDQHFAANCKKWLTDFYQFADNIRKPLKLQEFAPRKTDAAGPWKDYYISVDFAKEIVLRTKSKVKQKYARQLAEASKDHSFEGLNSNQFEHLAEVTKAMLLVSCQEESERRHLRLYKERNNDSAANWWKYRATVLGYTKEELRKNLRRRGEFNTSGNQRELIEKMDPLELVRAGVIDLFMAIGKSIEYAQKMGDFSKNLARAMDLEIIDDQQKADLFTTAVDPELVHRLKQPIGQPLVAA